MILVLLMMMDPVLKLLDVQILCRVTSTQMLVVMMVLVLVALDVWMKMHSITIQMQYVKDIALV